jgi:hypothetical protein
MSWIQNLNWHSMWPWMLISSAVYAALMGWFSLRSNTKARVKGLLYMVGIAGLFGFWQQNVFAAAFMLAFLWFIEKLVRMIIQVIPEAPESDVCKFMTSEEQMLAGMTPKQQSEYLVDKEHDKLRGKS